MAAILLATADARLHNELVQEMSGEGHMVDWFPDGLDAWEAATARLYELILLDEDLPTYNGAHICQMLRNDPLFPRAAPLILLQTAHLDEKELAAACADGQLPKRHELFHVRELLSQHLSLDGLM